MARVGLAQATCPKRHVLLTCETRHVNIYVVCWVYTLVCCTYTCIVLLCVCVGVGVGVGVGVWVWVCGCVGTCLRVCMCVCVCELACKYLRLTSKVRMSVCSMQCCVHSYCP